MFDGKQFGQEIVGIVKSHVEKTVAPLLAKIEALEKQIADIPPPLVYDAAADAEIVRQMIADAIAAIPPAEKGKDADPAEVAAQIAAEVERAVAALPAPQDGKSVTVEELLPAIEENVAKAVAAIPVPKDGVDGKDGRDGLDVVKFIRDDRGHLNGILRDGTTVDLGEYVGKDGAPGERGKDGLDGVGFDDMEIMFDEEGIMLKFVKGENVKQERLPVPFYRGVFKEGQAYHAGNCVSYGGSTWIAHVETTDKPDGVSKTWQLSTKRGRDGKDGTMKDPPKGGPVKVG